MNYLSKIREFLRPLEAVSVCCIFFLVLHPILFFVFVFSSFQGRDVASAFFISLFFAISPMIMGLHDPFHFFIFACILLALFGASAFRITIFRYFTYAVVISCWWMQGLYCTSYLS